MLNELTRLNIKKSLLKFFVENLYTGDFYGHAWTFCLACRKYILAPVIVCAVATTLMQGAQGLLGPNGLPTNSRNISDLLPYLLILLAFIVGGGLSTIFAIFFLVWRVAVVARAYLQIPFAPGSQTSRAQCDKALAEAISTMLARKGYLAGSWTLLSIIQIFLLVVIYCAASVLVLGSNHPALSQTFAPEYTALFAQYRIHAIVGGALALTFLNSLGVSGLAVSVLIDRSSGKVLIDSIIVSLANIFQLTLYSLVLLFLTTFIYTPDIIFVIRTMIQIPGYTEPVWVVFGRQVWFALLAQFVLPFSIVVLLECLRKSLHKKPQTVVLDLAPDKDLPPDINLTSDKDLKPDNLSSPDVI